MEDEKIDADEELLFCDDEVAKAAYDYFGIKYLFPWQRLVIANIIDAYKSLKNPCGANDSTNNSETALDGRSKGAADEDTVEDRVHNSADDADTIVEKDAATAAPSVADDADSFYKGRQIVLLPTGAGKSLCFQIPALLLDGPTLVVYPLLALMSDQERRMKDGGFECVVFRGGMSAEEKAESFQRIKNGAKIIIANPEILSSEGMLQKLSQLHISHIAIDEAHCVSEWGNSFRPSYVELGRIIKTLNAPVVTAFTATASPEVLTQISAILFDGTAHIVRSESDRPNIHYYVKKTSSKQASALFLVKTEALPMIIFCGTRSRAEEMSRTINFAYGKEMSRFYHAGLERSEKTEIEKWFFDKEDAVLCATCAYGMGVDKKNIRTVIHLDAPETAEAYIQEAGRGGRDGGTANAILLWNYDDEKKFSAFEKTSRKSVIHRLANTTTCRRQILLDALGGEEAVCDGCDLCDSRKRENALQGIFAPRGIAPHIPGDELPSLADYILHLVKRKNKYYTLQMLEEKALYEINTYSRTFTGVNIWWYEDFEECIKHLLSEKKIKIEGLLWKNRIAKD